VLVCHDLCSSLTVPKGARRLQRAVDADLLSITDCLE
jgi:hypothetical protein